MADWCLVTDIDGTLLGESESLERLRAAVLASRDEQLARGGRLRWVVATGRGIDDAREVLRDVGFADGDFDAFVTAVGAELYLGAESRPHTGYHAYLSADGFDAHRVRQVLEGMPGMRLQPDHEQHAHKVSYFAADTPEVRERVEAALDLLTFETQTIYCMDHYLDVAPAAGAKGGAVRYLIEHWGLSSQRIVAAGDSGNDRTMLVGPWPAIVVGNGHAALGDLRGHPHVYFASAKYAAGVHEGLRALGWLR